MYGTQINNIAVVPSEAQLSHIWETTEWDGKWDVMMGEQTFRHCSTKQKSQLWVPEEIQATC